MHQCDPWEEGLCAFHAKCVPSMLTGTLKALLSAWRNTVYL